MHDWDDLRAFLATARTGSFTAAADRLEISQSTVTRRIRRLETTLGATLFTRSASGAHVTPAAEAVLRHAEEMEASYAMLVRQASSRELGLEGRIRLATADVLAERLIEPLARFRDAHPRITIDVYASNDVRNLDRNEADLSVRGSPAPPDYAVGNRIVDIAIATYRRRGSRPDAWVSWSGHMARVAPPGSGEVGIRLDSARLQAEAIAANMGQGWLACFVGDLHPALERVPDTRRRSGVDLWVLTHVDLRRSARVRRLMHWLTDALRAQESLFDGTISTSGAPTG